VFLDSVVSGITYSTESQSGITNEAGEYRYADSEIVTFSIGTLTFPPVTAAPIVTPLNMSPDGNINDNVVVNAATLLQSLDNDGDLANGIQIPDGAAATAIAVDFNVSPDVFAQNPDVINLVGNSGSVNTKLIESDSAVEHLQTSIDNIGYEQITATTINLIFDKQLFLFDGEIQTENFIIVRSDGTFDGTWEDAPIAGTWEMRDGYWCRFLTEFFNPAAVGSEDCQLWELRGNQIRGTRDRGMGNSFIYNIVG
jgi:hypothetical protein